MSLFSALSSTANSLSAFEQALTVTQNNVNNASTPGYARQRQTLEALPFDTSSGETGGVKAGAVESSRDNFAEQNVRDNTSQLGQYEQQVESLSALQSQFDISGNSGIPAALNSLYSAFSGWSVTPGDAASRQSVVTAAQQVATAFQQTARQVSNAAAQTDSDISAMVSQVNHLTAQLAGYNAQIQAGGQSDPSLDAAVNSTLEALSEIANVTTLRQSDGTLSVLLGGQGGIVNGSHATVINVALSGPPNPSPATSINDANGNDLTGEITGGKLGGALNIRNQVLPSIQGNTQQPGMLNQLAQAFADRVNGLLTSGYISQGPPAQPGVPIFAYDTTNPSNVAASLQVRPSFTPQQLAAIRPGPPVQSNGIALALAGLSDSSSAADTVNGQTYTQFFGKIASTIGAQLSAAQSSQSVQKDLVAQAQSLRQQVSGVDLNQEATQVLQYQRSYQAAARMISVIDSMTQTALSLIGLPGTA